MYNNEYAPECATFQVCTCVFVFIYTFESTSTYISMYTLLSQLSVCIVLLPLSAQSCLNSCTLPLRTAGQLVIHTNTHADTLFFSTQPLSNPLVSIPGGIGLNNGMMGRVLFGGLAGKWNPPQGDL